MLEYLMRRLSRCSGKIRIEQYPLYYEENGTLIREDADGRKFAVDFDKNNELKIVRELKE